MPIYMSETQFKYATFCKLVNQDWTPGLESSVSPTIMSTL